MKLLDHKTVRAAAQDVKGRRQPQTETAPFSGAVRVDLA
jgi:hypothetical protein